MTSMFFSWLVSFSMAFSGQAVITFAAVRMLKSAHPGIIWLIAVIGCTVTACFNSFDTPSNLQTLWTAVNLLVSIATYVAFSKLRPLRALFVVACIMLVTLLAELGTLLITLYGFGINITTGPTYAFAHPAAYFFIIVFHGLMLGIMLYIVSVVLGRFTASARGGGIASTLIFPISQSVVLLAGMLVIRPLVAQDERVLAYGASLAIAVLGAYLLFYIAAKKMRTQELTEARISAAEERSVLVYKQTREMVRESQRVAKVRHDFRNQVQTIELLCEQGETARARKMVDELLEKVEEESSR